MFSELFTALKRKWNLKEHLQNSVQEENTGCLEVSLEGKMIPAELTQCSKLQNISNENKMLGDEGFDSATSQHKKGQKETSQGWKKNRNMGRDECRQQPPLIQSDAYSWFHLKQLLGQPKNDGSLSILGPSIWQDLKFEQH